MGSRPCSAYIGGRSLSGGQWQKLALARGLMRQAPLVVVLDEPTASLDAPTEAAIFTRFGEAARRLGQANGAITLLVSHRFSTVHMADQIVVMDKGRVVACGDHATLLGEGGLYAELFNLQARGYRSALSRAQSTAPSCQGVNSSSPKPSSSLFVRCPDATASTRSKISWPTSSTLSVPSTMVPQLTSMSSDMRP